MDNDTSFSKLPYIRRLFQKPFSFEARMTPKWPERLKQNSRFSISSWSKAEMLIIEIRKKTVHKAFKSSTKDSLLVFWILFLSGLYFSKRMHIYCGLWKLRDLLTLNGHILSKCNVNISIIFAMSIETYRQSIFTIFKGYIFINWMAFQILILGTQI